tara:strand:+ start:140 stop:514 length:375 start_codon:yes stop_codon:yes gene_type:complete
MAKKIKGEDKINDTTLHELLLMMDAKLNHLEDISADNRAIIVKLVKQSNQIVQFLKNLELEIDEQEGIDAPPTFQDTITLPVETISKVKNMLKEFELKREELQEFEDELKKHKGDITLGQIGEA